MATKVLVVGSGVVGLRTAIELIHRRIRVHLISPRHPLHPSTCSMGAGGLWMPFHCTDSRTDRWSLETLNELTRLSSEKSSPAGKLVETLPAVVFSRNSQSAPSWSAHASGKSLDFKNLSIEDLYKQSESQRFRLPRKEVMKMAGYSHAWLFQTQIVDTPKMLMHMLNEIIASEYTDHVDVETDEYYTNIEELLIEAKERGCDGLVNCTGLGSKLLCNDASLIGARGILLHYDRASCVWNQKERGFISSVEAKTNLLQDSVITISEPPFGSETMPCYMIPRGDIVAVGGSYLVGDEEKGIRSSERRRILENAQNMGIDTKKSMCVSEWVGFRPYRSAMRLEVDEKLSSLSGVTVVHSYGCGGSGWTVFVGVASDNANLLETRMETGSHFDGRNEVHC
ncbi:hypothetical protein ACHAXA_008087 [Cyclostephanos tholiformis]|uniref:FAD dependent oxidoreductase domain-containing protein n=1 Tax=Cyclostephanos tholiformis TaxID=382380 RepID=A0ABD3RVP4_9STRA